jgi:Rhodopirellula transposase DDE domain
MLRRAAELLSGARRRLFQAEVTRELCDGRERQAEHRFGWGRRTIAKGFHERDHEFQCVGNFAARGRRRWEDKNPQFAQDVRDLVEPRCQTHPELKLERCYTNMTAEEVLEALQTQKGYSKADLPRVRTMRDILNRMNYRLQRIRKAKPLKKTPQTNAIFANVKAVKEEFKKASLTPTITDVKAVNEEVKTASQTPAISDVKVATEEIKTTSPTPAISDMGAVSEEAITASQTLELSMDTKAKVNEGDYARGGTTRTGSDGEAAKGWDHDPPAKRKWTPLGILMLATGALTLILGLKETSDFWVDGLKLWWGGVKSDLKHIRRLVIYLDNGPNNSGTRTQFLKRMVEFAAWSGLEIRLVYYPPYHSKYNPVERCWSSLERKWGGALLNDIDVILDYARRMTWKGQHPTVKRLDGDYPDGVRLSKKQMKPYEARLERSPALPKYDITIKPING